MIRDETKRTRRKLSTRERLFYNYPPCRLFVSLLKHLELDSVKDKALDSQAAPE